MENVITNFPTVANIILYVVAFNLFLSGAKLALDKVKDQTKTDLDNKASSVLDKIIVVISKAIDAIGYNPKH